MNFNHNIFRLIVLSSRLSTILRYYKYISHRKFNINALHYCLKAALALFELITFQLNSEMYDQLVYSCVRGMCYSKIL